MTENTDSRSGLSRRVLLRAGAIGATAVGLQAGKSLLAPNLAGRGLLTPDGVFGAASIAWADAIYTEALPTSPLILKPFTDPLLVPKALAPVSESQLETWSQRPSGALNQQNGYRGTDPKRALNNETHQIWPSVIGYPAPIVYKIDHLVSTHSFTTSQVLPINRKGKPTVSFDDKGKSYPAGTVRTLPLSTIYGFNGTFPGPADQRRIRQAGHCPLR